MIVTTSPMPSMTDRIARFAEQVQAIDAVDLSHIADASIDRLVVDWGFVSYVETHPETSTTTIDGTDLAMDASFSIHMRDGGTIYVDAVVSGCDACNPIGLRNASRKVALAA